MIGLSNARARGAVAAAVAAALTAIASQASAKTVILPDTYWGGENTYNNADVIGPESVFGITDARATRLNPGVLQITIDTNFAGAPGTGPADGTGYGALFITPGANSWHPTGTGPNYATDVYRAGEWSYAVTMPTDPTANSGTGGLYAVNLRDVVMSNAYGDPITYPHPGNNGWYFREGQAVQYTPGANDSAIAPATWSVGPGKIVFDINDGGALGSAFSLSWAMTCANDVIQGQVSGVPEPTTWAMLLAGFALIGAAARGRKGAPAAA
ncbi:MAG: PEPxxWA-CTERM sorting domain-containing protein [Caulobacteraceae bacterium]